jgi:hypothetical protein
MSKFLKLSLFAIPILLLAAWLFLKNHEIASEPSWPPSVKRYLNPRQILDRKKVSTMIRRFFKKPNEGLPKPRLGINPPIIVDEQGTAMIFESTEDAERYLEPIDVRNNEYVAYDSEGRLLRLIPTTPHITIESAELEPRHSNEVRELLENLLAYTGVAVDTLRRESLQNLVLKSLEYKTR